MPKRRHRTTHAPRSVSNCACPRTDNALRTRHDQHRTAHARASSPHCACSGDGTALRMPLEQYPIAHACASAPNCACPSVKRTRPQFHRFATGGHQRPRKQEERRDGRGAAPQLLALRSLFVVRADENAVRLGLWEEQVTSIGKRPRKPKKASHTQQTSANCLTVSVLKSLNK